MGARPTLALPPNQNGGHAHEPGEKAQEGRPLEQRILPDVGSTQDPSVRVCRYVCAVDGDEDDEDGHHDRARDEEPAREPRVRRSEQPQAEYAGHEDGNGMFSVSRGRLNMATWPLVGSMLATIMVSVLKDESPGR